MARRSFKNNTTASKFRNVSIFVLAILTLASFKYCLEINHHVQQASQDSTWLTVNKRSILSVSDSLDIEPDLKSTIVIADPGPVTLEANSPTHESLEGANHQRKESESDVQVTKPDAQKNVLEALEAFFSPYDDTPSSPKEELDFVSEEEAVSHRIQSRSTLSTPDEAAVWAEAISEKFVNIPDEKVAPSKTLSSNPSIARTSDGEQTDLTGVFEVSQPHDGHRPLIASSQEIVSSPVYTGISESTNVTFTATESKEKVSDPISISDSSVKAETLSSPVTTDGTTPAVTKQVPQSEIESAETQSPSAAKISQPVLLAQSEASTAQGPNKKEHEQVKEASLKATDVKTAEQVQEQAQSSHPTAENKDQSKSFTSGDERKPPQVNTGEESADEVDHESIALGDDLPPEADLHEVADNEVDMEYTSTFVSSVVSSLVGSRPKFEGLEFGLQKGENVTKIAYQLFKLISKYKIRSMTDISCVKTYHWMPHFLNYVGMTIPGFEYSCIVFSEEDKNRVEPDYGIHFPDAKFYQYSLDHKDYPEVDLVLSWDFAPSLSAKKVWRFMQNMRASKSKYLITSNYPSFRNNPGDIGRTGKINLGASPFNFKEPIKRVYNVQLESEPKQLLFYALRKIRENL